MLLLATACTGGDGGTAATASPNTTAATASPTTTTTASPTSSAVGASPTTGELPASLASAKGWLAYSTYIDDLDRIHLTRVDGSQDHQAFTELPGEAIRADFSRNGQLAFEHRPPNDAVNVYVANADGTGAQIVAACKLDECERAFPAWSPDGKSLATTTALGKPAADGPPPHKTGKAPRGISLR
jgi:hypothetical protein